MLGSPCSARSRQLRDCRYRRCIRHPPGNVCSISIPPRVPRGMAFHVGGSGRRPSRGRPTRPACRRIAQRPAGDYRAADDVLIEKRRRHFQDAGDVVEAVAEVVIGKQGARIDVESKDLFDGICVFRAIHSVQCHASRDWDVRRRRDPAKFRARTTKDFTAAFSGWRAPGGGIIPPRSLRTASSQIFASLPTSARFIVSRVRPAVLRLLVMAGHAVLGDECLMLGYRRRAGLLLRYWQGSAEAPVEP